MTARQATSGVALTAAAVVTGRYLSDLHRARARLARLERRSTTTPFGPLVDYCEWGEGEPLLLIHGVVGGCDVPPSWRALVPASYRIITPSRFRLPRLAASRKTRPPLGRRTRSSISSMRSGSHGHRCSPSPPAARQRSSWRFATLTGYRRLCSSRPTRRTRSL